MSDPVVKEPRTSSVVQLEMAQQSGELGFLYYQREIQIPIEMEKHTNHMITLQKEYDKLLAKEQAEHQAKVELLKAQQKSNVVDIKPNTQTTETVQ